MNCDSKPDRDTSPGSPMYEAMRGARDGLLTEMERLRDKITWLRNQMGDVRGMQSDGATPEEMDEALGRALSGERARQAFDESRRSIDDQRVGRCPTCDGAGPDVVDRVGDYGGDVFEARCGDEWHDSVPSPSSDLTKEADHG